MAGITCAVGCCVGSILQQKVSQLGNETHCIRSETFGCRGDDLPGGRDDADIHIFRRVERHIRNAALKLIGYDGVYERNAEPRLDHAAGDDAVGRGKAQVRHDTSGTEAQGVVRLQPRVYLNIRLTLEYRGGHAFCLRKGMIWRQHGDKAALFDHRTLECAVSAADYAEVERFCAYIFSKTGLETLGTFNLLAARFLLAFLVLGVIFWGRLKHISRHDLLGGAILGAALILSSLFIPHFFSAHPIAHRQHH